MTLLEDPADQQDQPITGGTGFYRPKRWGLMNMGPIGTAFLFIATLAIIGTVLIPGGTWYAVAILAVTGLGMMFARVEDKHGKTGLQRWQIKRGYRKARRSGSTLYTPGRLTDMGSHRLPGAMASSTLSTWTTATGEEFAVLAYPQTHMYVVTASAQPDGASLLDQSAVNTQVEKYGDWLGTLAQEPDFVQGIITIETAPDSGPLMRSTIEAGRSDRAHPLAKRIMGAILDQYPQGSQGVEVTVSATFRAPPVELGLDGKPIPKSERPDEAEQVGKLIAIRAPHLFADLPECGAGDVRLLAADDLIERIRVAYNPVDRKAYSDARAAGKPRPVTLWSNAGPSGSQEHWSWYQHGGGASVTWEFTGFTSSVVRADGLLPLLETGADSSTRISIIYQPIDPGKGGRIVENNFNAADGRLRDARKPTAKQYEDKRNAHKARTSTARGHALIDFAILVTKTVTDETSLPAVRTAVNRLGPNARLNLRPCDGMQAVAFAQGLGPLGLVTDRHLLLPRALMNGA